MIVINGHKYAHFGNYPMREWVAQKLGLKQHSTQLEFTTFRQNTNYQFKFVYCFVSEANRQIEEITSAICCRSLLFLVSRVVSLLNLAVLRSYIFEVTEYITDYDFNRPLVSTIKSQIEALKVKHQLDQCSRALYYDSNSSILPPSVTTWLKRAKIVLDNRNQLSGFLLYEFHISQKLLFLAFLSIGRKKIVMQKFSTKLLNDLKNNYFANFIKVHGLCDPF